MTSVEKFCFEIINVESYIKKENKLRSVIQVYEYNLWFIHYFVFPLKQL